MLTFAIVASILWAILAVPFGLLKFLPETVFRLLGLVAVLGASYLMLRVFHRKPLTAIGLYVRPSAVREFWLGVFIAVLMQSLVFLVQWSAGWVSIDWRNLPGQGFLSAIIAVKHLRHVGQKLVPPLIVLCLTDLVFNADL